MNERKVREKVFHCDLVVLCFYVIAYGWETWSLTLNEGHRLKVFDNMVRKGMFGLKRDEVV
jgi:hypothetical protein